MANGFYKEGEAPSELTPYEIIKEAIYNKQQVHADYNGYHRLMCPHVIGSKNGRQQALFYQFGGDSKTGLSTDESKNWRCIPINELHNIQVVDAGFKSGSNHSRPQTCVDIIDVEVEF